MLVFRKIFCTYEMDGCLVKDSNLKWNQEYLILDKSKTIDKKEKKEKEINASRRSNQCLYWHEPDN